ncbi:MAG: hypothetical protein M3N45_04285, partial [Actinomycetota bacterium]|nr:hypothetical protein [Actinomycetota bacterium]
MPGQCRRWHGGQRKGEEEDAGKPPRAGRSSDHGRIRRGEGEVNDRRGGKHPLAAGSRRRGATGSISIDGDQNLDRMLRRTRPWRTGSALLKRRAPVLWEDLAAGWGRAAAVVGEPLQMARDYPLSLAVGLKHRAAFSDVQCFVMFVGYPRSGHTIVGSLLNAHPNIVMGHRLRVLRYVAAKFRREQLLAMVLLSDRRFEKLGRVGSKRYNYSVPGQWQGRHSKIRVIGDSNVVNTFVRRRPELLPQLAAIVGVPTRMIHVVRNP